MDEGRPWTRFGEVLKRLRTEREMSQAALAELIRLDQTTISLLERGERQPTLPTLYKLSDAFEMSLVEFVAEMES